MLSTVGPNVSAGHRLFCSFTLQRWIGTLLLKAVLSEVRSLPLLNRLNNLGTEQSFPVSLIWEEEQLWSSVCHHSGDLNSFYCFSLWLSKLFYHALAVHLSFVQSLEVVYRDNKIFLRMMLCYLAGSMWHWVLKSFSVVWLCCISGWPLVKLFSLCNLEGT